MRFTEQQYREALVRLDKSKVLQPKGEPVKSESDLHDAIIALCKERGWYYVHSRMDRRHTNAVGTPDFIIAMDKGRVAFLECKSAGGKATTEQLSALVWLQKLGHRADIVTNMDDVLKLLNA
jgi:hypothetical protein